jgi:hypothetical protein
LELAYFLKKFRRFSKEGISFQVQTVVLNIPIMPHRCLVEPAKIEVKDGYTPNASMSLHITPISEVSQT